MKYLEENLGASKVQLSSEELHEIRKIINSINITGTRYSELGMKVRICILVFYLKHKSLVNINNNLFI